MFIELHMVQNFSPANLNRDDTNNPKDCEFGGVRRARISSQCIKRAIRWYPLFKQTVEMEPAVRTRRLVLRLRERLAEKGYPDDEVELIASTFPQALTTKEMQPKKAERTDVLVYLGQNEIDLIVNALNDNWTQIVQETRAFQDDPKKAKTPTIKNVVKQIFKAIEGEASVPDVALFGRMLASQKVFEREAACQVAHAISTHRVTMEMDFYTAVDDLNPEETAGAGMMGFTGFDSACFYRYARLDWDQLVQNLNGDVDLARRTVEGFLRAAVAAVPTGKQTSFAANNPPSFLLAVVRRDGMGWSLANAFERPVSPRGNDGLVAPSVTALDAYWGRLCQVYGTDTLARTAVLVLNPDLSLEHLQKAQVENLEAWVSAVTDALPA
jgi:CRISPR system Cascade subunit CasC